MTDVALWRIGDPYPADWVDADTIVPSDVNPRRGDVGRIAESIAANGFWLRLLVQRWSARQGAARILVGNHRYRAGRSLGMERFPVDFIDADDDTADRILVADNRYGDLASWDDPELVSLLDNLASVEMLVGSGYTDVDLAALHASIELPDDDDGGMGRVPSPDVRIAVGTVSFTVERPVWDAFEASLIAEVGMGHDDHVNEIRGRLGL